MDWVNRAKSYKGLYGILQLLQGSHLDNFLAELGWVAFPSLKCPCDQIFDIHFFTFSYTAVGLPRISCQILIYLKVLSACFLGLYFCESTAVINFPCSNWRKWRHILKNTAPIEMIITITVQNCTNTGTKGIVLLHVNCCTNIIIISILAVFLRKWHHLLQFSTKSWNKEINGSAKFSEIKVPKNACCNVRKRSKFGKISRKQYILCKKM